MIGKLRPKLLLKKSKINQLSQLKSNRLRPKKRRSSIKRWKPLILTSYYSIKFNNIDRSKTNSLKTICYVQLSNLEAKSNSTNTQVKTSNQILKNDKDFAQYAKAVGKRFNDQITSN